MRQCCDRSMRAVGSRERVVDIEVAELGKGPSELRRIRLLALVEAKIFEERHFAWAERRDHPFRLWADAIGRESDLTATDRLLQGRNQRPQGKSRVRSVLGTAEMRHHDHLGASGNQRLDRRGETLDPGCIGNDAVLYRDVQIGTQQHGLVADIEVVEGSKSRHQPGSSDSPLRRRTSAVTWGELGVISLQERAVDFHQCRSPVPEVWYHQPGKTR